ncbi:PaREP1 family protein [Vulcanisaeta thermophila]|uniref:PaREP1 family protein n=1 Tax=Vulcanisaeta thermophila TaxID=867917 RepID=UPI0008532265|nr:PaREP1 family protein [Vulcanisaeta thermophila]
MQGQPELLREVERRIAIISTYSRNYQEYLRKGERAKASEMLWGIVNNLASILSIIHGEGPINSHAELRRFMDRLAWQVGEQVLTWYRSCEVLHAIYYHNFMDEELFEHYRSDAENLIDLLNRLVYEELGKLGIKL